MIQNSVLYETMHPVTNSYLNTSSEPPWFNPFAVVAHWYLQLEGFLNIRLAAVRASALQTDSDHMDTINYLTNINLRPLLLVQVETV